MNLDQAAAKSRVGTFFAGVRDQLPLLLGVIPFGLIFGALAVSQGIPGWAAQGLSLFVFAGSAQFVAAELVGAGAPALVIVFTILVVNLRHLLYSASLAPSLRQLPGRWRVVLAWLLTDEAFATTSARLNRGIRDKTEWYMLGTGLTLWGSWQVSTALGVLLGAQVPASWSLDFALPLTFMALIVPSLTDRPAIGAAAAAGISATALAGLPFRLGLVLASLIGIAVGVGLTRFRQTAAGVQQ
jgi:4-azaleucine resistance transporter AzlC